MFVSDKVVGLFQIAKETVDALREELAVVRAERDILRQQVTKSDIMTDFLRVKVNQLELQNGSLMEKAYNIKVAVPEIMRRPTVDPTFDPRNFSFDDMGNIDAKKFGLPTYDEN